MDRKITGIFIWLNRLNCIMNCKSKLFGVNMLILALILSPGCTTESTDDPGIVTPPIDIKEVSGTVDGNNRFALDYYSKVKGPSDNIFFSPWSMESALAMTYEGAREKTAEEMASTLHLQKDDAARRNAFASLYAGFNQKDAGYTLSTANALWVQKDYPLLKEYLDTVETYYHGKASNVDYRGATEEARKTINSWVEGNTNNKIKDLIPPGILDADTRLVLTNAVYFKGTWIKEFNKADTREQEFRTGDGRVVSVPMMSRTDANASYRYAETSNLQILEMPYKGDRISMLVLLPKNDIASLENTLTQELLSEWRNSLKEQRVNVFFPKYKLDTKYSMAKDLQEMGMPSAFNNADFSGMDGTKNLVISDVIHQAFVEVNEEGTEAAAATAVVMKENAMQEGPVIPTFSADHPFIFIIQDKETGMILFMGRMSDPSKNTA
jgi:serpin B